MPQTFPSAVAQLGMDGQLAKTLQTAAGLNGNLKAEIVAIATIATADAIDPATTMALCNINKAKINAIIAALKA